MSTATCPECRVIVQNDILGTRSETILPQSPDETMESSVEVIRAVKFAQELNYLEKYGPVDVDGPAEEPLGVVVRKSADTIIVRWWAPGDRERATEKLAEIQGGRALI